MSRTGSFSRRDWPEALLVKLAGLAPSSVEGRLHAGHHTQLGNGSDVSVRDHLYMLQTMPGGAYSCHTQCFGGPSKSRHRSRHGVVSNAVKASLQSSLCAGDHMIGDLPLGEVAGTTGLCIGVRITQRGGTRADRPVDT